MVKPKRLTRVFALQNGSPVVIVEHIGWQWFFLGWISVGIQNHFVLLGFFLFLWISFWGSAIDFTRRDFPINVTSLLAFKGAALVGLEAFLTTYDKNSTKLIFNSTIFYNRINSWPVSCAEAFFSTVEKMYLPWAGLAPSKMSASSLKNLEARSAASLNWMSKK